MESRDYQGLPGSENSINSHPNVIEGNAPQQAEQPKASWSTCKKLLCGATVIGLAAGAVTGLVYGFRALSNLDNGNGNGNSNPSPLPLPIEPPPPYMPILPYTDAANVIVNGTVRAIWPVSEWPDCPANIYNLNGYLFWSQNLENNRYTFFGRLFGSSVEAVRVRALEMLKVYQSNFPFAPIGYGVVNLKDEVDWNATWYMEPTLPPNDPDFLSNCEGPLFVTSNNLKLIEGVDENNQPQAKPIEKLKQSIAHNPHGFKYANNQPKQQGVDISDEEMAKSVFGRSKTVKSLRG